MEMREGTTGKYKLRDHVQPKNSQFWPTPSATDYKGAGKSGELRDRLDYATERGGTKRNLYPAQLQTGTLNPLFVEWLMGFPEGWSDLKDSAIV